MFSRLALWELSAVLLLGVRKETVEKKHCRTQRSNLAVSCCAFSPQSLFYCLELTGVVCGAEAVGHLCCVSLLMPGTDGCCLWCRSWSCARCAKLGAETGGMRPPVVSAYLMLTWTARMRAPAAGGHEGESCKQEGGDKMCCVWWGYQQPVIQSNV